MRQKTRMRGSPNLPLAALSLFFTQCLFAPGLTAPARAHQAPSGWTYPVECCSDTQDCQTISGSDVTSDEDGYIVTLAPGEHRHAPEGGTFYMLDNQIKPSGDDNFHVCIHEYTNGPGAICLYIPQQGLSLIRSHQSLTAFGTGGDKAPLVPR